MNNKYLSIIPGFIYASLISIISMILAQIIKAPSSDAIAIILGIIIGNTIPIHPILGKGLKFSEKRLLEIAIALLGIKLNFNVIMLLGPKAFAIILPMIILIISLSIILAKFMKINFKLGLLIGVGNAICGSSAIAAVAPLIKADSKDIGISIGTVNLMGTIGIFILPVLAVALGFSNIQISYLLGGGLQAIGHVAAASFSIGPAIGKTAIIIKMIRVIMIGPISIISSIIQTKLDNKNIDISNKNELRFSSILKFIPIFIIAFIFFSILGTAFSGSPYILEISRIGKFLLTTSMAAIGLKIRFKELFKQGKKVIMLQTCLFAAFITFLVFLIKLFI